VHIRDTQDAKSHPLDTLSFKDTSFCALLDGICDLDNGNYHIGTFHAPSR